MYYDKPITGSPFRVSAYDWRSITVENLNTSSMLGRMVEFDSKVFINILLILRLAC